MMIKKLKKKYSSGNQNSGRTKARPGMVWGFTLIETLVAITVLLTAIAAPLTIANDFFSNARETKNQLTAVFLAQEAIEYIRSVRDTNLLQSSPWLQTISTSCPAGNNCNVDAGSSSYPDITNCGSGSCSPLGFDPATSLYRDDSSFAASDFTRNISISYVSADEILITVDVSWGSGSYSFSDSLFNWN